MDKIFTCIGFMSGTSMDGIDCALIKTDGERILEFGPTKSMDYSIPFTAKISKILGNQDRTSKEVMEVERELTDYHVTILKAFLQENNLKPSDIDVIGFHGQTTFHAPQNGVTIQIGDGQRLADETGIPVVFDFRTNDVKHGGQGAPLAPVYHAALVKDLKDKPVVILNQGGVGNVTYIDEETILAFDTGPANGLMNDLILEKAGQPYDVDGALASKGKVNLKLLETMLNIDYLDKTPPKSLDRYDYKINDMIYDLSLEDGLATLMELTIQTILASVKHFPKEPKLWLVTGGGRKNKFLMEQLNIALSGNVQSIDTMQWRGDFIEAEAFAFMAARHLLSLPISFPTTTSCPTPLTGGVLVHSSSEEKRATH